MVYEAGGDAVWAPPPAEIVAPASNSTARFISLPPLSTRSLSTEVELCDLPGRSVAMSKLMRSGETQDRNATRSFDTCVTTDRLTSEQLIYEAALLSFCDPPPYQFQRLLFLSRREWKRLLYWLDISGLALYFLNRIAELQRDVVLPPAIGERLRQNLADNTERTRSMVAESVSIQREFQEAGLTYATVKGFSLCPTSVPRPELRHQFDLDFLISEESATEGRRILELRGYRLYAISGKSWEFKMNGKVGGSIDDLYKDSNGRAVELHIETDGPDHGMRLKRVVKSEFYGISMPVLSPIDLFLGQGLHAFKDVCSSFSRTAHLLEFRRHVLARHDDDVFWSELQLAAGSDRRASLGLGVVVYLIERVMGEFAPAALTKWTADALPQSVRLWVDLYGCRTVFGKATGSKLYLILQQELESAGLPAKRSLKSSLIPSRLPPAIFQALPNEKLSIRIARYRLQLRFILFRLRFHVVEGLRYSWESYRWRRLVGRLAR
jgi:hypothetical protein